MLRRIVVQLLLVASAGIVDAEEWRQSSERRARPVRRPSGWIAPQCALVRGIPAVSFTTDGGQTLPQHEERLDGVQIYTFGLAALEAPNRLLAVTSRLLISSTDGGCEWSIDGRFSFPQHDYRLLPRSGGGAWAWSTLAPELFMLDDGGSVVGQASAPTLMPISFSADPRNPALLAVSDDQGRIWWSDDAAASWALRSTAPARAPLYALEPSPHGRSHVIAAGPADGAHVSFDGGLSWTSSAGVEGMNVFRVAFSPLEPQVVWAIALDPKAQGPSRRAIFHSSDGGRSFRPVIRESASLDMPNGFTLAPSPVDPELLHFVLPGSVLHLVDASGRLRSSSPLPYRDVNSIAFAPGAPRVMYMGLKISEMSLR